MKVKQITLGSSTLVLAALLTACGGSSSSGVQKPTPLVANTNNPGNHGATNHGNHGATNPSNHGNHGATNHGNHGNHGANNHGNHGNHGVTNSGNHGTTNPVPKWDATVSYASFKNKAIKEAKDYVHKKDGVVPKITGYTLSVDGKAQDGGIDLSEYPKGRLSIFNVKETVTGEIKGKSGSITTDYAAYLFKQDYSLIAGIYDKNVTMVLNGQETKPVINDQYFYTKTSGAPTEKLPTTGKFNYSGSGTVRAKGGVHEAKFSYDVDFGAKTGSGRLGNITLSEDKIKAVKHDDSLDDEPTFPGVKGKATAFAGILNGDYILGFYGPDAAEIVGSVELGDDIEHVGGVFGGTKQK